MSEIILFIFRFLIFAMVHSILAIPSFKKRCIGQNTHLCRFYRLYYNLVSIVIFGWVMGTLRNSSVLYFVPGVWSLLLYIMQMIFLIVLVVCASQTGVAAFLGVSGKAADAFKPTKLVTDGWYRIVRHPLYLISMLFLLSNPVISVRWLLLTLLSAVYFLVGAILEERRLLLEFGDEYSSYQLTVPFIIPRISLR